MTLITDKMVTFKTLLGIMTSWMVQFFAPIYSFIFFMIFLVLCDLFTGTQAALVRKETLHSRGFRRSVVKMTSYLIAILATRGVEFVFLAPQGVNVNISYVAVGLISLTEFKSNLENIQTITGVPLWGKIGSLIPSIGDYFDKEKPINEAKTPELIDKEPKEEDV
jgi:hypothetical protein